MKFLFTILFLLSISNLLAQNYNLCVECSQNLGNGFSFENPNKLKGDLQLVSSSVGLISSNPVLANDSSKLISGYMPVCILPVVGLGMNDTSFCSDKEFIITSGAYLIDNIYWTATNNLNYVLQGNHNEKIICNEIVDRETQYEIEVFAEKGSIKSTVAKTTVFVFPKFKPIFSNSIQSGNNFVCNNKDIVLEIKDSYYNDDQIEIIWDDNIITNKRLINISSEEINKHITLKIKNKNNLCDTTISFTFKPLKPEATVQIITKDNLIELDPSEYEDSNNNFYIDLKLINYNDDLINALKVCPPKTFKAEMQLPKKILVPTGDNFTLTAENLDFKTLTIKNNIQNMDTQKELFRLYAVPIIIDQVQGIISVSNIALEDESGNSNIYKIFQNNLEIAVKHCKIDGQARLLNNYYGSIIKSVFPNPIADFVDIKFNKDYIRSDFLYLQLYDSFGKEVYAIKLNRNNLKETFRLNVFKDFSSGVYKLILTDGYSVESANIIVTN